jgi:putative ABC transport system substrate-binding protein
MRAIGRREFIAGLGGAALWPLAGRAQQGDRVRRIGVLLALDETDPEARAQLSWFTHGLGELGWTDGRNLRTDVRWAGDNVARMQTFAKELVELQPDVILAYTTPATAALRRETRTIPIVFTVVGDPVGSGFVAGPPRPGGNITGLITQEATMGDLPVQQSTRFEFVINLKTAKASGISFPPTLLALSDEVIE